MRGGVVVGGLGGDGVDGAVALFAFGAAAAQDAADDGEAKAGEDEVADVGKAPDEVREEEDDDSGVDEDGEDAAQECTSTWDASLPGRREACGPVRCESYAGGDGTARGDFRVWGLTGICGAIATHRERSAGGGAGGISHISESRCGAPGVLEFTPSTRVDERVGGTHAGRDGS